MMTLYEQAHFQLDDPVDRWIPEWKNMTVREADPNGGSRIVPGSITAYDAAGVASPLAG